MPDLLVMDMSGATVSWASMNHSTCCKHPVVVHDHVGVLELVVQGVLTRLVAGEVDDQTGNVVDGVEVSPLLSASQASEDNGLGGVVSAVPEVLKLEQESEHIYQKFVNF